MILAVVFNVSYSLLFIIYVLYDDDNDDDAVTQ